MPGPTLVLTCEHGGNRVPAEHASLFASLKARKALAGHRGCDLGALALARSLARRLDTELIDATVTRLLVDLNRSLGHRALFSEFSRGLERAARERVLRTHYRPHRERVRSRIAQIVSAGGSVVHVAVHSFVPRLGRERRAADIGLLYDSARRRERAWCDRWRAEILTLGPTLRVRRNYPYRGAADGLTTALRREFARTDYIGVELEVNQALLEPASGDPHLAALLGTTLARALD